jgi:VanZ family protein
MARETSSHRQGSWAVQLAPAAIYVVLVFIGGSIPTQDLPQAQQMPSDKLMHLVVFGGMQLLMFRAVRWSLPLTGPVAHNVVAALLSCATGALLEFWQAALPHRSAELLDWLADSLGVLLVAVLLGFVNRDAASSAESG